MIPNFSVGAATGKKTKHNMFLMQDHSILNLKDLISVYSVFFLTDVPDILATSERASHLQTNSTSDDVGIASF